MATKKKQRRTANKRKRQAKKASPLYIFTGNIIRFLLAIVGILFFIVLIYLFYILLSYNRITDNKEIELQQQGSFEEVELDTEYTISTYNLGFGAYTPDFTFFMDGGTQSWANSKQSVKDCITGAAKLVHDFEPDFALFQEVDTNSTRSYHVNENALLQKEFADEQEAFAVNYHSAFLFYPLTQPHGKSNSGIATFSKYNIKSAMRKKLEVTKTLRKFLDLDRCYSVSRIPTSDHHELLIYNIHSSAYEKDSSIRNSQMEKLFSDMQAEFKKGNYCVCGGDFNHDFTGDSAEKLNKGNHQAENWAMPFPDDMLPEELTKVGSYDDSQLISTSRNCDIPYGKDSFVIILDGYLVSNNIEVTSLKNIDTSYVYSDHNPVVMKFKLSNNH